MAKNRRVAGEQPPIKLHAVSVGLLCKLGSIIIHFEEAQAPGGTAYDVIAIGALIADPEVKHWLADMRAAALLPVKRTGR